MRPGWKLPKPPAVALHPPATPPPVPSASVPSSSVLGVGPVVAASRRRQCRPQCRRRFRPQFRLPFLSPCPHACHRPCRCPPPPVPPTVPNPLSDASSASSQCTSAVDAAPATSAIPSTSSAEGSRFDEAPSAHPRAPPRMSHMGEGLRHAALNAPDLDAPFVGARARGALTAGGRVDPSLIGWRMPAPEERSSGFSSSDLDLSPRPMRRKPAVTQPATVTATTSSGAAKPPPVPPPPQRSRGISLAE